MNTISISQGVVIRNPQVKAIADEVFKTLQLAMDKAVAHHFEPKAYPLARGDSFERLFLARFKELHAYKQQAARTKVMHRIKSTQSWRRAYYGRLAAVNLASSVPVQTQVAKLPKARRGVSMDGLAGYYRSLSAVRLRSANGGSSRAGVVSAAMSAMTLEESGVADVAAAVKEYEKLQAITKKYKELGGEKGFLGPPVSEEHWAPDGQGRYRHYKNGSIYWHPKYGAHEVHGAIREKWKATGWEQGVLGYPTTDEMKTPDGKGRYNHFKKGIFAEGSIYWHPNLGAFEVHGGIRQKWKSLGWEKSFLGYPVTDELTTPDGIGRYNHFQNGSIYFSWKTGAHEVHGAIREFWKNAGWEQSFLGYPVTDEMDAPDGKGKYSKFQGGTVRWHPDVGAYLGSPDPVSKLSLRMIKLHCIDETNGVGGNEYGEDEMAIGGTLVDTYGNVKKINKKDLGGYYDDGNWSDWEGKVIYELDLNQTDGIWPKTFIATLVLVEVDSGGYTEFLNKMADKLEPYVKQKVKEAAMVGGQGVSPGVGGLIIGYIAGEIGAYIVDKIFNEMRDWWNDDLFTPSTLTVQVPGPGALFEGGTYDSPDFYWDTWGHGGEYEYWVDWTVH
ncbi:hypothetical protein [Nitrososphaera sp.]|uniref:LGFP repeat-containing protein n=1 Tax=Nitrososphaera sp. TaxID=1971748 RepID=UPI00316B0C75